MYKSPNCLAAMHAMGLCPNEERKEKAEMVAERFAFFYNSSKGAFVLAITRQAMLSILHFFRKTNANVYKFLFVIVIANFVMAMAAKKEKYTTRGWQNQYDGPVKINVKNKGHN